jgi:D-alanine--poly(phosphoribitol) ligase subunit 1
MLFFKERLDFQIKIRGYRVELDEINAAIRTFGWPVASAFKRGEAICAVVEEVDGQAFDEKALRKQLASKLESYAVPDRIRAIDRMPRNENDKIDRKAAARWFEEHA